MSEPGKRLEEPLAEQLADRIRGSVVGRATPGYELRRTGLVWNGRPAQNYPDLIVRPDTIGEVRTAIRFAREHGLTVSVRGSGHSYSGVFLHDGGMLLDLSGLDDIVPDIETRTVSVGPGATGGRIDAALAHHGLAFPVGHGAQVGIAGFLLGGGIGINGGAWGGMSCHSILAADMVMADGRLVRASAGENADLFRALRGGGPGLPFVVVRFILRCYRRPNHIALVNRFVRFSQLPDVARAIERLSDRLDSRLQVMLAIVPAPAELAPRLAQDDHNRLGALTAIAFADDATEAERLHAPLDGEPALQAALHREAIDPAGFDDIFAMTDMALTAPRVRADNIFTDRLGEAVAALMRHLPAAPSPACIPLIVRRNSPSVRDDAAFSIRGRFSVSTYAQAEVAEDDRPTAAWLHRLYDDLLPIASGCYVNEVDLEGRPEALERCHSPAVREELAAIRKHHDPHRLFRGPAG
ncbi:FAD-binding oxidoreductase [Pelagerythrobacter marensis]|uniref:FAD-binding PCMH-type domain-containing protein n=1 Tax=Pelagerythrobacter marensis TaxID=543877 RepID=A0A0G3XBC1_9SPHN|nr:FAD-binding oxidoreductase [Pelagerythrobacter marensis]AKM08492.1 hypothetical protein AM2010_2436 [Pelagerythrobacter marensis]